MKTFLRPKLSLRFPANGIAAVTAISYTERLQAAHRTIGVEIPYEMGKATATTVMSMADIRSPMAAVTNMRYRRIVN